LTPLHSRPLTRTALGRPAPPVRMLHLGLGGFFRAHQAWYTDQAPDAADWGIAAFTHRSTAIADTLTAQQGLYTLVTRAADGDRCDIVGSVAAAHRGADHAAWLDYWRRPELAVVSLTVTEAGYTRVAGNGLDTALPAVQADIAALRADPEAEVATPAARLLAGLAARQRAGGAPVAVVPCDNLPANGRVVARAVEELAAAVGTARMRGAAGHASYVTTMVDRITPYATPEDTAAVAAATGWADAAPVVTEPYSEWVLSGEFPAGRPDWGHAGAQFVADATGYEERKLWLLNGGHSLLAYAGSARGHDTVAAAAADPVCRRWLGQWWDEASRHLDFPAPESDAYRAALLDRFDNPRIRHTLAKIAEDGSQKLPVRIMPTLRAERKNGNLPSGAMLVVAAWLRHLRGAGVPVRDTYAPVLPGSLRDAAAAVVAYLDPVLVQDTALVDAVTAAAWELL
jgi:fructuronate reductase